MHHAAWGLYVGVIKLNFCIVLVNKISTPRSRPIPKFSITPKVCEQSFGFSIWNDNLIALFLSLKWFEVDLRGVWLWILQNVQIIGARCWYGLLLFGRWFCCISVVISWPYCEKADTMSCFSTTVVVIVWFKSWAWGGWASGSSYFVFIDATSRRNASTDATSMESVFEALQRLFISSRVCCVVTIVSSSAKVLN